MSKAHKLQVRKPTSPVSGSVPINFLLGCSDTDLASYELAQLAKVSDLRKQLHEVLDQIIDKMGLAWLTAWFRSMDRNALAAAIDNEETAIEWAKRMIRERQRSVEELIPAAPTSLPPGAAHLAAAMRYQERNVAEGKCAKCPEPLDRSSVRHCTKHMAAERDRYHRKKALSDPGSREYLYSGEITESTKGRHPNNLAALAMGREQRTRAFLAEQGIKPENAAISLNAVTEALLKVMPKTESEAMRQDELFQKAGVVTKTTGQKALKKLLAEKRIRSVEHFRHGKRFRYFVRTASI
jgi:hypothetical protein